MKNLVLGLVCLTLFVSCGGSNGGKSSPDAKKFRGLNTLETEEKVTYLSDCYKTKTDGETSYVMAMFQIEMQNTNRAKVTMNQALFTKDCEIPVLETEVRGEGMFLNDNTLLKTTAKNIFLRPLHDEMTYVMNTESMCGFDDWMTASQKDITHTYCIDGSLTSDVYINAKNNGATLTVYICEEDEAVSSKCEKIVLNKMQ